MHLLLPLGRKKDPRECRGKLTTERRKDPSSLCTCGIPLPNLSHVRNSNFAIWSHFSKQELRRVRKTLNSKHSTTYTCREHSLSLTEAADNLNQQPGNLDGVACICQITHTATPGEMFRSASLHCSFYGHWCAGELELHVDIQA